ncbi:MAG: efflux RND transporter periplasmic adaptor subunit [Pseudomonadota bacterium]
MFASFLNKLLIIPPILLAMLVVWVMQNRPIADAQELEEARVPVRVVTVAPLSLTGSASGFGRVETTRTWSGVAEVEGRLTRYEDTLQPGARVRSGEVLFEIEPRDYEIAVAQAQADVLRSEADLQVIGVNARNTEASLEVERQILEIYLNDRNRIQGLVERGAVAATELETANRTYLTQQSSVTSLEASLAQVEPDTLSAEASLAKAQADLESAERDLARTTVVAPFEGRVTERGASAQQYVRTGDVLVTIENITSSEVEAAFQPTDLGQLLDTVDVAQLLAQPGVITPESIFADVFGTALSAQVIARFGDGLSAAWPAKVTRLTGSIDEATGSVGIVVQVDGAGEPDRTSGRPPLVNGSFVEVVLTGPSVTDQIVIPETALRYQANGTYTFIVDAEDRLARQDVTVGAEFNGKVIISEGLEPGDRVVLSDPRPATLGLLLNPIESGSDQ